MAHCINIDGLERAKYYAMKHPKAVVRAHVREVSVEYKSFDNVLYYRPQDKIHLPESMGWATCKMQTV